MNAIPPTGRTGAPRDVVLIIADISGYTRFMLANKATLAHAQLVINELMKAVIRTIAIPLKVSKLEGDAIFLYGFKTGGRLGWDERRRRIRDRMPEFFNVFRKRALELQHSRTCDCGACANADRLRLKLVVHSGQAVMSRIGRHEELSGPDVITVHRLLKNTVPSNEYILLTEPAWRDLGYEDGGLTAVTGTEHYDDVGDQPVRIHFPFGAPTGPAGGSEPIPVDEATRRSLGTPIRRMLGMGPKMVTMMLRMLGLQRIPPYRNLPAPDHAGHRHD